jgi:3-deoxy-D-manno-octulosonic-acid transferase
MMRLVYGVLTRVAAPAVFAATLVRAAKDPAYRTHLGERFGLGRRLAMPSIWLHAVSVGEVAAAAALVRALHASHPDVPFVLTTATPTGRAQAATLFGADVEVRFLPYDTAGSVRRFLARIRPRAAIIMETELWPNLLHECGRRGVPVLFASARLAARSMPRYRRFGTLFSAGLRNAWVAAQSIADAGRFIALGADPARTHVTGNLKFDMRLGAAVAENGRELRRRYLGARPVWTAGSTHEGEEDLLLDAHAVVERAVRGALLVLVPRHPQRFEGVAALLERRGLVFDRRGRSETVRPEAQVLLLDTMGELTAFYAASDAAFVGGSLVPVGGHNLLEPAALGVPVITGPHTQNGPEIARLLIEAGGALEVADGGALAAAAAQLLADPALRERMGESARSFVEAHRGSLARLLALIEPLLTAEGQAVEAGASDRGGV